MIPLRVALDGFMSYREKAELVFEGAPLWVLSGRNGSGKSAIFDAITYALYGVHRGGTQNAKALINHGSKSAAVEFDFSIGDESFRVKRTLARRGASTVQAFRIDRGDPVPIAETETRVGFDRWVSATIGLDVRTFTASVLLLQGRSEALLDADPKARHEMLGQVIDLSAYERLCEGAEDRYRAHRAVGENVRGQLAGLEVVDEREIVRLRDAGEEATRESGAARARIERIVEAKAEARRWRELTAERDRIASEIAEAESLMARAKEIESAASRSDELSRAVPLLVRLVEARERHATALCELAAGVAEQERASSLEAAAAESRESARATLIAANSVRESLRARRDDLAKDAMDRLPHVARLDRLDKARETLVSVERALAEFPPNLDGEVERLRRSSEELADAKAALPLLRIVVAAREAARRAVADEKAAIARNEVAARDAESAERDVERANRELSAASQAADDAARRATEAGALLAELQRRQVRFDSVDGAAACSYCGQPLTKEHLATERARLEAELKSRETGALEASQTAAASAARRDRFGEVLRASRASTERLAKERDESGRSIEQARQAIARELARAQETLATLPERYADRVAAGGFPSAGELAELSAAAATLDACRRDLAALGRTIEARARLQGQQETAQREIEAVALEYPAERERELRTAAALAENARRSVDAEIEAADIAWRAASERSETIARAADEASAVATAAASAVHVLGARRDEIALSVAHAEEEIPAGWKPQAAELDAGGLAKLREEADALARVASERERLVDAQRGARLRSERLRESEEALGRVPDAARRSSEDIERDECNARNAFAAADARRAAADAGRRELENRQSRRRELEDQAAEALRAEQLYRELARLLGRDRLQRHLLMQAESAVAELANEVLDRLSGGTLWLELKRDTDTESKTQKALDLVAHNTETGGDAIPVAFLSGSQRFRVAVSLALAIGRYASQGGRRIESVIIDEGFGSLDREGRREMIDELHALKSALDRIILVSHQEEFASAFAHKYVVELVDGTSRVRLASES